MSDKGEYRAIYTAIVDDPAFQALSPNAKLVFFFVKLQLGPSGIGVLYPAALAEQCGIPSEGVANGIQELTAGGDHAWLRVERNIVWIRNGLKYEPNLTITNEKHRKSVESHLRTLPKLGIVNAFASYYGVASPFSADTHANGYAYPYAKQGDGKGEGEGDGKGKGEQQGTRDAGAPADAAVVVDLTQRRAQRDARPSTAETADRPARKTRSSRPKPPEKMARPEDWAPNAGHREQARRLGLNVTDVARGFCRWHDSRGVWLADWDVGFEAWLDGEVKRAPGVDRKAAGAEGDFDVTKEVFE